MSGPVAGKLAELVDLVTEGRTELKVGVHCAERRRHTAARTGVMGLALLLLELAMAAVPWLVPAAATQPFPRGSFCLLGALCFCLLLVAALLWVFHSDELKALRRADDEMRLAAANLQEELRARKFSTSATRHTLSDSPANQDAEATSTKD